MESEKSSREKGIYKVTIVGSIVNFLLLVFKFFAGIAGHSAAMLADAVHSLSDFITDIVVIVFVRIAGNRRIKVTITAMANTKPWLRPSSGCYFCVSVSVSFGMGLRPFILFCGADSWSLPV